MVQTKVMIMKKEYRPIIFCIVYHLNIIFLFLFIIISNLKSANRITLNSQVKQDFNFTFILRKLIIMKVPESKSNWFTNRHENPKFRQVVSYKKSCKNKVLFSMLMPVPRKGLMVRCDIFTFLGAF